MATSIEVHGEPVLSFGKHRGKTLEQLDDKYLRWMHTSLSDSSRWRKLASEALEQRKQTQEAETTRKTTVLAELKVCGNTRNLKRGKDIHDAVIESGDDSCIYVATALVKMYAKCGSMGDAQQVFNHIENPDVVSWTSVISGYAENGDGTTALDLFTRMKSQGCTPDYIAYVAALKACASLAQDGGTVEFLERGKQIHSEIKCHSNVYVQSTLIDMYIKCGSIGDARQVFDSIKRPSVVAWNALILGYVKNGECVTALDLFSRMKAQGCTPNCRTFAAALKACGLIGAMEPGRKIHEELGDSDTDAILVTSLVDFYGKCGSLAEAHKVFEAYPRTRDLIAWNSLLSGYCGLGDKHAVFRLFEGMRNAGLHPDGVTFLCILTCCSHAGLVEKANEYFEVMSTKYAMSPSVEHYNCMVDMLGRLNKLEDAMALLRGMLCRQDAVIWLTVMCACRRWKNVVLGRLAFTALLSFRDENATAYVLMAHIYGSKGMWQEQELVLSMQKVLRSP